MKKSGSLSFMVCIVFFAFTVFAGVLNPSGAQALQKSECYAFRKLQSDWFYIPSTLPDSVEAIEWSAQASFDYKDKSEFANTCSITFVSGDETLKDALQYKENTSDYYNRGELEKDVHQLYLYIDNEQLKDSGTAVFHVKVESEHYVDEENLILRVFAWNKRPLLTPKEETETIFAKIGDILEEDRIASSVAEFNEDRIVEELKKEGITVTNTSNNLSVYTSETNDVLSDWENIDEYIASRGGTQYKRGYQVKNYGSVPMTVSYNRGNVRYSGEVRIVVSGYRLSGPRSVRAGETAQYTVIDAQPEEGRTFAVTAEGEGIQFDADTLTLTVPEGTPDGTAFQLTAVSSDGGEPVILKGKTGSGLLTREEFETATLDKGFSVPTLSNKDVYTTDYNRDGDLLSKTVDETGPYILAINYSLYYMDEFLEDPVYAGKFLETVIPGSLEVTEDESILIDGHPARMILGQIENMSVGRLYYPRNNWIVLAQVRTFANGGTAMEDLPQVTAEDVMTVADRITYNPQEAPVTVDDGKLTVTAEGNEAVLSGGKKLALTAAFASPDKVNRKENNDTVEWNVTDTATGKAPEGITVDRKGNLSARKTLTEVKKVEVKATSPIFHTEGVYEVTVIPAVKKIKTDPKELVFYVGADQTETVKAVLEPDTVPTMGLTWTSQKKGIVEITDHEDGTADIRALSAGKSKITVKEPGGKSAKLSVSVLVPVESVELTVKGKTVPGGTVSVSAALLPKNAANRKLEWSVNTPEDVAAINAKGQVRIRKTAPEGTVITVTCKAVGAPEPIISTIDITVGQQ